MAGILLVGAQHLLINRLSSGSIFDPEYPRPWIIAFNVLFGAMLFPRAMQILSMQSASALLPFTGHFPSVPPEVSYGMGELRWFSHLAGLSGD